MDYPSQYGWRGQREDTTRTTRYSCITVVGHVIVKREMRVQTKVQTRLDPASFQVVLGDFGCDVTCQACREVRRGRPRAIALGSKPPLVTQIARTGLGTRLGWTINPGQRMASCWVCTKNLCFSSDALSREPAMLRLWAWILHLLILNGGNGLELACNRGSDILLPRISLGCKLQSWTKVLGQLYSSNAF